MTTAVRHRSRGLISAGILVWAFGWCAPARAADLTLDGSKEGRVFEGIGAVSAGASSRLLIDYPEPQRSQILDYLFKPGYGASLQHLKVEIGGGVNSTDGTEPSHMRTGTEENYQRGYEWWLMAQAKARNPGILLDSLAWGAPGWIGGGQYWSQDMADYVVKFIKGARTYHNLDINFTGLRNEVANNTNWIITLRNSLDANGLSGVRIVAGDEWGGSWNIVEDLLANSGIYSAVYSVGAHYPKSQSPTNAQALSKPIWASEDGIGGRTWSVAVKLAKLFNRNYVTGKMTKTEIWSPITAYYDNLLARDSGLMRANTPWSGNYLVAPAIWAAAHTTQFAWPGWKYLEGGASDLLVGGSVVTLKSTNGSDYSIVIETIDASAAQVLTFHLTNGLSTGPVRVWRTMQTDYFRQISTLTPVAGTFSLTVEPGAIYSITTTTGQGKGNDQPPPAKAFPLPFQESFESYSTNTTPKWFSDQAGTFEVVTRADGQGKCLRQVLPEPGIRWMPEFYPYTLLGESGWSDYEVSADVYIETNGFAFVMGRIGTIPSFSNVTPPAYWLKIQTAPGAWELRSGTNLLASGNLSVAPDTWHRLRLAMMGNSIRGWVNGAKVVDLADNSCTRGLAAIGCGWHYAQFDNFAIRRLHRIEGNLALNAVASASSIWSSDYTPDKANDGDPATRWNSAWPMSAQEWLQLDFGGPTRFNAVVFSQFADRIMGYKVQAGNGGAWTDLVIGGQMGPSRTDTFPAVTNTSVRLLVTNSTTTPSIYEFQVFDDHLQPTVPVRFNEWMLSNTQTLADPADGQFWPWVELFNSGTNLVDLGSYFLGNSPTNHFLFQIPSGVSLAPGACLLAWADNQPGQYQPGSDLHLNFTIAAGQLLTLTAPDGEQVDAVDLDAQPPDCSFGSKPDGDPAIVRLASPSPRASNNQFLATSIACALNAARAVVQFSGFPFAQHQVQTALDPSGSAWATVGLVQADALGWFGWQEDLSTNLGGRVFRAVTSVPPPQ